MTGGANLSDVVRAHSESMDAVALISEPYSDTGTEMTYRSFDELVQRVAGWLSVQVAPGGRVAVLGDNSPDYLATILGAARAGRVAVPLNPRQGKDLIAWILGDADVSLVLAERGCESLVPATVAQEVLESSTFASARRFELGERVSDAETALLLYTSGSSGRPKGVMLTHEALLWPMREMIEAPAQPALVAVVASPLFHMNGLMTCLFVLAQGGRTALLSQFRAKHYLQAIERHRAVALVGVPTMFVMLLEEMEGAVEYDVSSVLSIASGSAPLSEDLNSALATAFPHAQVHNVYGTTEAFGIFGPHPSGLPTPTRSVGAPRPGVSTLLVDGPSVDEGRLLVRTPASMQGYLDPTAQSPGFIDGYYDTGDLVRVDSDGFFYVLGRADDMIICGAENLFPAAIEDVLLTHPRVLSAAVVGRTDPVKGEVPIAFVVVDGPGRPAADELQAHARARGPVYAFPREIHYRDALPLTAAGKVDRQALREALRETAAGRKAP